MPYARIRALGPLAPRLALLLLLTRTCACVDLYIPPLFASQSGRTEKVAVAPASRCDALTARDLSSRAEAVRTLDGADAIRTMRRRFRRCAVVGNAGHLTATSYGRAIDAHDTVIHESGARLRTGKVWHDGNRV